jgi:hypothetical protein
VDETDDAVAPPAVEGRFRGGADAPIEERRGLRRWCEV